MVIALAHFASEDVVAATPTPPVVVAGPAIVVDRCSLFTANYAEFAHGAWWNDLAAIYGMAYCTTITYPSKPLTVTRGNWDIQIPVTYLGDHETGDVPGPTNYYPYGQTHTTVSVVATATSIGANPIQTWQPPNPSQPPNAPQQNPNCNFPNIIATLEPSAVPVNSTGTITLYDINAPDAPSGAATNGQQDVGNGASGVLHVPLAVDWARSEVTFNITVTQSLPNTDAPESIINEAPPCDDEICALLQFWTNTSQFNSSNVPNPQQSSYCGNNCVCPTPQNSVVYIEPPALLQLNLLPLTIVYSPLGPNATSSFTLDVQTGTNIQFGESSQTVNATTVDDKEALSGGITIDGFTGSGGGSWDNSVLNSQSSTGEQNVAIANAADIGYTSTVPWPTAWPGIDSLTYTTQPFWNDVFLVAVNPQLAVWDYPSGAIVEPLGSASFISPYVHQLYQCAQQNNGVLTYFAAPIPGTTSNNQVALANSDCLALLQLDPFWVADGQNAVPPAYRTLLSIGVSGAFDQKVNEQYSTTFGVTEKETESYTAEVTAIQSNNLNDAFSGSYAPMEGGMIGGNAAFGVTNTTTGKTTLTGTYTAQSGSTLANSVSTSNEASDAQNTQSVGVVFYQDAYLGGIAIQDQSINLPHCRLGPVRCGVSVATFKPCELSPILCNPVGWHQFASPSTIVPNFNKHIPRPLSQPKSLAATYKRLQDLLPLFAKSSLSSESMGTLTTIARQRANLSMTKVKVKTPPPIPIRSAPLK